MNGAGLIALALSLQNKNKITNNDTKIKTFGIKDLNNGISYK